MIMMDASILSHIDNDVILLLYAQKAGENNEGGGLTTRYVVKGGIKAISPPISGHICPHGPLSRPGSKG
jgi:hypothetical protein